MDESTREEKLLETLATLADTLVVGYDAVDLLQTLVDACRDLLDAADAGIFLADARGELEVIASTRETSRFVEMLQFSAEAGPCAESFRTGTVVSVPDLSLVTPEWSNFRNRALDQGFCAARAVPLRLREQTIGTLNLLRNTVGELDPRDATAARAFADMATIGILHERTIRERTVLTEQLQTALSRRIVIEQAKGVVAHTHRVPVDEAFALIRNYARSHQLPVSQVAAQLVSMSFDLRDGSDRPPP